MNSNIARRLVSVIALVGAAAAAQTAFAANVSPDPFTSGARITERNAFFDGARAIDPYLDGARVGDQRSPFTDGARVGDERSVYTDGARTVAGLDRSGPSADPARSADPYLDGARVGDQRSVYTDGALA